MKQLADDLYVLDGFPPYAINVYLVGDVLVDAATRRAGKRILRQLRGRNVNTHAVTHAHPDHQGASHEVCEALDIPLWCGERDADAIEDGRIGERQPQHPINSLFDRMWTGPPHPVAQRLREGDMVGGFKVLDTPGHSAGHISLWRESDGALICGDVFTNIDQLTGIPGLHEPKSFFSPDPLATANRCDSSPPWNRSSCASATAGRCGIQPSSGRSPTACRGSRAWHP